MNRFAGRVLIFSAIAVATSASLLGTGVHANAPSGRYEVGGSGAAATVLDTKTQLTWQRTPASALMSSADAKSYCAGAASMLGGEGWRLPAVKELLTLVDYSRAEPAIDETAFPGTPSALFWSSTPLASSVTNAWAVGFDSGATSVSDIAHTNSVRCVR